MLQLNTKFQAVCLDFWVTGAYGVTVGDSALATGIKNAWFKVQGRDACAAEYASIYARAVWCMCTHEEAACARVQPAMHAPLNYN